MNILYVSLGDHQHSLRKALNGLGYTIEVNWRKDPEVNTTLQRLGTEQQFDLCFFQLQTPGIIKPKTLKSLSGYKVNWTGDVRFPTPQWYSDMAPHFDMTLFTNEYDVQVLRKKGLKADYLPMGFEDEIFVPNGHQETLADVVFMANNYGNTFPLSSYRTELVRVLSKQNDFTFAVCGSGWPFTTENLNKKPEREAAIYRGAKMAINLSHFDYPRYSSGRMFNILGSGTLCLSHHYQGVEVDFKVGTQLDTFRSIPELVEMIRYYLRNDMARMRIATNGCDLAHGELTWEKRMAWLISSVPHLTSP
ncbi:hypothetical protein BH09BAC1_BH09BAC1_24340 [soil metagenome]